MDKQATETVKEVTVKEEDLFISNMDEADSNGNGETNYYKLNPLNNPLNNQLNNSLNNPAVRLSDIFFTEKDFKEKKIEPEKPGIDTSREFVAKGTNIKLDHEYDIHFSIGSVIFENISAFLNDIGIDTFIIFKKRDVVLITLDTAGTHASITKIDKTEFLDYEVKGLENDADEHMIFIENSIITEELTINENYPVDFYVDTRNLNRFYVLCGKGYVWGQLTSITPERKQKYKNMQSELPRLLVDMRYQRAIINQYPLISAMKSLSKKEKKRKTEGGNAPFELHVSSSEIRFSIQNKTTGGIDILSGEDVLVYPTNKDMIRLVADFFTKFGNLKLTYNTNIYVHNSLPIILESRMGSGHIKVSYIIAPQIENE